MVSIIIKGLNWIFVVGGIIGIVGIIFLVPAVIIAAVIILKEKDEIKKKAKIKKGIIFALIPFGLIIVSLIGIAILQAIKSLLNIN